MYLTDELFPERLRESVEPLDEGGDHGRRGEADHGVQVGRGLRLAELWPQSSPHGVHLEEQEAEARFNRPFDLIEEHVSKKIL